MNSFLIKTGYILDVVTGIWSRQDYTGIAYSDGDEVEQRIASIINEASDLGVLSSELRQHCTDWPSLYHLSGTRANILRPFENDLHGDILEIGAGCGAITRYLGECGGNVLALEGSPRRAAIARARTRDLQNVTVVSDRFDLFSADQKFDAITLIGVLEYANLFTPGESPALNMLERVRALLKPEGKLFIAIENQLGLKYFAGAPEDHLGQPMYGIEGRYRNDQPQTFGRIILAEMLKEAGFSACDFLAPFPDYKLPVSVITERGFKTEKFDAAAFAWQSVHRDPQLPPILAFSPELVWPTLAQNGLALDLANSFLIVASSNKESNLESSTLAWHFTTERKKEFCKTTQFVQTEADGIEVRYKSLAPALPRPVIGKSLKFDIPDRASYVYGIPLSQEFIRIVTRDGWRIEELCILLRKYLDIVANVACTKWQIEELSEPTIKLPGSTFDCIPQNIITSTDGGAYIIDKEWEATEPVQIGFLCFRSLITLFHNVTKFGHSADEFGKTYINLIQAVMNGLGWLPDKGMIISYVNLEAVIQTEVSGRVVTPKETMDWLDGPISKLNNLNQAVTEKDGQIASLSQAVIDRDKWLEQYNQQIKALKGSHSWKITSPLRIIGKTLRKQRTAQRASMEPGAVPTHKDYPLWRKRISYLTTRYNNGVQRHGLLSSLPLAMRAFHRFGSVWMEKQLRRRTYERRLRELRTIIIEHTDFIDLFHVPMGWSTPLFQRFQHMSLQAAQLGGLALYGGHLQVDKDLFVFNRVEGNVVVFDALDDRVVQCVFDALLEVRQPKMLRLQSIDLATKVSDLEHFIRDGIIIVYEYIDEISEEITGAIPAFVIERHKWLLRNEAVFVVTTSDRLFTEVTRYRTSQCILSTNGVDLPHWRKTAPHPPADMEPVLASERIVVGYHGALAKWIDYDLLKRIASDGKYELVLIGYAHDDSLEQSGILDIPNVHFLGSKSYFILNEYAVFYDIGILPFKRNELTESVSPVKLFEYMAASKPIVTTYLPECAKYKSCLVSGTHDDFLSNLAAAAVARDDPTYMKALADDAEKNSWAEKAALVYQLVGIRTAKS
ncbi:MULTISPECIES: methyltransferase [Nitrosomonas]|uniref:Methyltransferase type 12 domain-containing protein n=1 Tax=Nitrosomonas europaea (strain ATCC 19718 / CIP 103999 / KCTC 2705 / NBRC 14298) TaxID=228410 RepID=Q82X16_NITEU|nr:MULTISPECIES: methyltransferase [Nitrosomonas]CAD84395.1 conserved hypothetical protein [Nitrosomonas europaea ATCC 19718]SDW71255.1 Glycosyl transferases group 1 [Nitrosomonas europaea]SES98199.1 Glycosyl transferases group 1 [Nitrosomonas europaea]SJZ48650.1 Methyltransferase domain-containing protein [Nitrosomonas europaea]HBF24639.1 methyltransferase domain-containing protein [Nitrosomonas sp.]